MKKKVGLNPEAEERERLKEFCLGKGILSPCKVLVEPSQSLDPSKELTKHHGKDIVRKSNSQRKNRYLFSFPALLGPISATGGKIGELKDLASKNPILYLQFPNGQLKLFGTITYPKNKYLTLQFSKKNVTCDDYFDNMIVFSDAWWIGTKDENPDELRLEFPQDMTMMNMAQNKHYFKGGIGVPKQTSVNVSTEKPPLEEDDDPKDSPCEMVVGATPLRHSSRTAGKAFNVAQVSSADAQLHLETTTTDTKTLACDTGKEIAAKQEVASGKNKSNVKSKDASSANPPSPFQTTPHSSRIGTVTKERKKQLKRKEPVESVTVFQTMSKRKGSGLSSSSKGDTDSSELSDPIPDPSQVDDEEFSSSSQDADASDEDWMA